MNISRRLFAFLAAACIVLPAYAADSRATPEEAKAMLAKAIAHVKAVGPEKAAADFMVNPGAWVDRDLYLSVYDMTGKTVAHINTRMVGKDNINLQDANGKFHVKERFEIVKAKGKGQQEFAFLNPMTKQIENKVMFFEKVGEIVVACGAYKPL
jgi:signal transduction histidine kinase